MDPSFPFSFFVGTLLSPPPFHGKTKPAYLGMISSTTFQLLTVLDWWVGIWYLSRSFAGEKYLVAQVMYGTWKKSSSCQMVLLFVDFSYVEEALTKFYPTLLVSVCNIGFVPSVWFSKVHASTHHYTFWRLPMFPAYSFKKKTKTCVVIYDKKKWCDFKWNPFYGSWVTRSGCVHKPERTRTHCESMWARWHLVKPALAVGL